MDDAGEVADVFKNAEKTGINTAVFKKPIVIGKRPGTKSSERASDKLENNQSPSLLKQNVPFENNVMTEEKRTNIQLSEDKSKAENNLKSGPPKSNLMPLKNGNLNYVPPPSSSICNLPYTLEVLKDGTIIQTENLESSPKPFIVFGRLPSCDIVLQHPSISRYHAVLQYKSDEDHNCGWYLFDLGSTHGTYLNKQQISPKVYCRVHSGHIFKLGVSTRMFILQGPEEDQEAVSELTVTQLKELKQKRALSMAKLDDQQSNEDLNHSESSSTSVLSSATSGINWGIQDDAEDEDPLAVNPFAMDEDDGNHLDLDDPKKTLRGWFEREGYELEYKVEEKSYAHFVCRIELPIDSPSGAPIIAEASVKGGKKKEVVVQCALEACRILDRHGLLRQSKHESKKVVRRRKRDDDYYSSDEDTFLDRTGEAERKRKARMSEKNCVETYESLSLKYENVIKEIAEVQQNLTNMTAAIRNPAKIDPDDVDAYMIALQAEETNSKKSAAVLRLQLTKLQREEARLKALINIARPSSAVTRPTVETKIFSTSTVEIKSDSNHVSLSKTETVLEESTPTKEKNTTLQEKPAPIGLLTSADSTTKSSAPSTNSFSHPGTSKIPKQTKVEVAKSLEEPSAGRMDQTKEPSENEKIGLVIRKRKKKGVERKEPEDITKATGNLSSNYNVPDDSKYAMWIPPEDQAGDGKNSLNRKYGY